MKKLWINVAMLGMTSYFNGVTHSGFERTILAIIPVMVITLKPSKAVMAKWKYSFQEIAAVVLNRLLLRKDKHDCF
jgi:hypothetical protein